MNKDNRHLWILGGLLAAGFFSFLGLRALAVPNSFGDVGYFRADHMKEEAARAATLVPIAECAPCHQKVAEMAAASLHKRVNCVICHGVAREHVEACKRVAAQAKPGEAPAKCSKLNDGVTDLILDRNVRSTCVNCHQSVAGRPKTHKQINVAKHLKKFDAERPDAPDACLECHVVHAPAETPEEPEEGEGAGGASATP